MGREGKGFGRQEKQNTIWGPQYHLEITQGMSAAERRHNKGLVFIKRNKRKLSSKFKKHKLFF